MRQEEYAKKRFEKVVHNEENYNFVQYIKELRKSKRLSIKDVCADIGCNSTKLSYLESGVFKRIPTTSFLQNLAEYYGIECELLEIKCENFLHKKRLRAIRKVA